MWTRVAAVAGAAAVLLATAVTAAPARLGDAIRLPSVSVSPPLTMTPPTSPLSRADVAPAVPLGARGPHLGVRLARPALLRSSPDGRVVTRMRHRARFGGPHVLAVVARRGRWLGVLHQWMPNGKAGWIHERNVRYVTQRYSIEIDRSSRVLRGRTDGRLIQRFVVSVGRPGHATPLGRFAITDRLLMQPGSPYGCCVLALSGRQKKLPPGWPGGDRLAIHGAVDGVVGREVSAGCVRMKEKPLRSLMGRVPIGTRVTIVA